MNILQRQNKFEEEIGKLFRERRKAKNMPVEELARSTKITRWGINRWERGAHSIRFSTAMTIANALGITATEIQRIWDRLA